MSRNGRKLLIAAILTVIAHPARARTQIESPSDTMRPQPGASYWGPIPPPGDSVLSVFQDHGMAFWESALVWPYRVIGFPFVALRAGIGESIGFLDETGVIRWIGQLLRPPTVPLTAAVRVSAGGLSGFGAGLTLEHSAFPGPDHRTRLSGATTLRGTHKANFGLRLLAEQRNELTFGTGLRIRPNARFFGVGPETQGEDVSFFRQRAIWLGSSYRRRMGQSISLEADAVFSGVTTGPPGSDFTPVLADRFAGQLPPGYDEASEGISLGFTLAHDDAPETGRPNRGGIRRVRAALFQSIGAPETRFWTSRAELQQFLRLWFPNHVLALRGYVSWIDRIGLGPVPFQRLLTNDDPDLLRGYLDFRWRDRGMVVLSAEYRWPLWAFLGANGPGADIYLLADVGQVFGGFDQITFENLTASYGVGMRLISGRGFVARLEYGRSNEEWVLRLRGDQIFQFARGSLFYGRGPIPIR